MDPIYISNLITTITKLSPLIITKYTISSFLNVLLFFTISLTDFCHSFLSLNPYFHVCLQKNIILIQYIFVFRSLYSTFLSYPNIVIYNKLF